MSVLEIPQKKNKQKDPAKPGRRLRALLPDLIAACSLAVFGLTPLIVTRSTLRHRIFDLMILDYQGLTDDLMFPLIENAAWLVFLILAGTFFHARIKEGTVRDIPKDALHFLKKNPALPVFALLILWMCLSVFFVNGPGPSVYEGSQLRHESFFLHLEYYLGFFFLGMALRNEKLKKCLLYVLLLVSILLVPAAAWLASHMTQTLQYIWEPSFEAVFSNPNYYGYFLTVFTALSAALFAESDSRLLQAFSLIALVVNTTGLAYNNTMGAWVGSLFACIFLVVSGKIKDGQVRGRSLAALLIFLATLCIAGLLSGNLINNFGSLFADLGLIIFNPENEETLRAGSGRWRIWMQTLELIRRHPLFGLGFEGIYDRGLTEFVRNARPHNEYLQYAVFYGIPAALLYITGILLVYLRALKYKAQLTCGSYAALTAAFGYLAGAFFGLTVYNTAPYLFMMLGLGYQRFDY